MTKLSARIIRNGLTSRYVGQTVYYWPAIGSTNDELKRLADDGAPEGTLAITDEQLKGRGRLDRTWIAPARSSLLMSLLFRPTFLDPAKAQQLTMICSLAAADAVTDVTALQPNFKWPNDLLLNGKKLAGVLTEVGFQGDQLDWVVVGVGLNINIDFAAQPVRNLAEIATSLMMALDRPLSRLDLLRHYLVGVETRHEALRASNSPHQEWAARLATLGQSVTVTTPDGIHQGIAESVDESGALLLRRSDGQISRILAGDVILQYSDA